MAASAAPVCSIRRSVNFRSPRALPRWTRLSRRWISRCFVASCQGSLACLSWFSSSSVSRRRRRSVATPSTMRSCFSSRARALTASWPIALSNSSGGPGLRLAADSAVAVRTVSGHGADPTAI
jgi:hypothetical protein